MLQKLKSEFVQRIREDQELQLKIAKAFNKKNIVTVYRWARSNDPMLTTSTVLDIIKEHDGLAEDVEMIEVLEEPEKVRA